MTHFPFCCAASLVFVTLGSSAQVADEHASHHPEGNSPTAQSSTPAAAAMSPTAPMAPATTSPAAPGMAGGGMGDMMSGMMAPANPGAPLPAPTGPDPNAAVASAGMPVPAAPAECMGGGCGSDAGKAPLYPSLMTLPALTPEKRVEIEALARQQLNEGMGRLASGYESLNHAAQASDHVAMQGAIGVMREAIDEVGAGVAAKRVLSEGKAPRNLALDWFKREMNLASPIAQQAPYTSDGVAAFHLTTMLLLITFALTMVVMYFFKMRRTAALFGRIDPKAGAPPPGSSPPLSGGPGPSSPVVPPSGKAPAAGEGASPTKPAAESPLTSTGTASGVADSQAKSGPPLTANWRGQLRVGSIITETPSVKTFRLLPDSGEGDMPFTFVPGQFVNIAFSIGGARMNRSYSISSSPTQRDHIDLTVRREPRGAVSRHFDDLLKVGDAIEVGGPVGRFTFSGAEAESIVLIAGGVGITPMMSIARYLTERSWVGDIFMFYACRAPIDFIFATEIAELQRVNQKLHVVVTMSDAADTEWQGPRGFITGELLTQTVPNLASRRIHLCGPPLMMESIKALLDELGVPADHIKTESFGPAGPTPAAAATSLKSTAPATGPMVTFSRNDKSSRIHADQSVLELSEELAIGIEYSCRVGTCGVCKVKMTIGEVEMAVEDALEPDDRIKGIILACQAKPKTDIAVEA